MASRLQLCPALADSLPGWCLGASLCQQCRLLLPSNNNMYLAVASALRTTTQSCTCAATSCVPSLSRLTPCSDSLQDVYEDDKHVHLVMELCTGGGILDRIEDHNYTERRIAQIMRSVIRLARLH